MAKKRDDGGADGSGDASAAGSRSKIENLHVWQIQAVRDVLWVGAVIAFFWLGYKMSAVTVPLLLALLLAYLFEPLVAKLAKHEKLSRPIVVAGLLCTVGVAAALVITVTGALVVGQTNDLIGKLADGTYSRQARSIAKDVSGWYDEAAGGLGGLLDFGDGGEDPDGAATNDEDAAGDDANEAPPSADEAAGTDAETIDDAGDESAGDVATAESKEPAADVHGMDVAQLEALIDARVDARLEASRDGPGGGVNWIGIARTAGTQVWNVVGAVVQLGLLAFLVPFYFYFFSVSYPGVVRFGRNLIPDKNKQRTLELLGRMDLAVAGFVRGRIVISIIMGVMLAIGWAICGVPYTIPLGLVVGVFCAVPYLGGVGVPLAIVLSLFEDVPDTGSGWFWLFAGPIIVFVIVQLIEGYVLTPMIAGKATNLDPVAILVAVLAGGALFGVFGMLIAIPIAACLKIIFTDVLLPRIHEWMKGERQDPLPFGRD